MRLCELPINTVREPAEYRFIQRREDLPLPAAGSPPSAGPSGAAARKSSDLRELPDNVRAEMRFTVAERIEDVLPAALLEVAERLQAMPIVETRSGRRSTPHSAPHHG